MVIVSYTLKMYSINNKYSVIDPDRMWCKYREKCDWAFNLFENQVVIFLNV